MYCQSRVSVHISGFVFVIDRLLQAKDRLAKDLLPTAVHFDGAITPGKRDVELSTVSLNFAFQRCFSFFNVSDLAACPDLSEISDFFKSFLELRSDHANVRFVDNSGLFCVADSLSRKRNQHSIVNFSLHGKQNMINLRWCCDEMVCGGRDLFCRAIL